MENSGNLGRMPNLEHHQKTWATFIFEETGSELDLASHTEEQRNELVRNIFMKKLAGKAYDAKGKVCWTQGENKGSEPGKLDLPTEDIRIYTVAELEGFNVKGLRTQADKLKVDHDGLNSEQLQKAILKAQDALIAARTEDVPPPDAE